MSDKSSREYTIDLLYAILEENGARFGDPYTRYDGSRVSPFVVNGFDAYLLRFARGDGYEILIPACRSNRTQSTMNALFRNVGIPAARVGEVFVRMEILRDPDRVKLFNDVLGSKLVELCDLRATTAISQDATDVAISKLGMKVAAIAAEWVGFSISQSPTGLQTEALLALRDAFLVAGTEAGLKPSDYTRRP